MKEIISKIKVEDIHKKLSDSPLHSLHSQIVSDINKLRELGKDIPICEQIINDLAKPVVYRTNLRFIYAGMACILNVLLEQEQDHGEIHQPGRIQGSDGQRGTE
jgi:hypothetical protein